MNPNQKSRWLVLSLVGVAILGAVLWMASSWTARSDLNATPAAGAPPLQQKSDATSAAGAATSDMLRMARAAFEACGAPAPPSDVPDGGTATREQMGAARATVTAFDEATTIYTRCVDTTAYQAAVQFRSVATSADTEALSALQTQLHNAAIDRDQALANRFNVQLRVFKARGAH